MNVMGGCASFMNISIYAGDASSTAFFMPASHRSGLFYIHQSKKTQIMKPPKTVVERAKANGSIDRASLLLSAAYLLNSEASNLVEEAGDILRANGLLLGELKKLQNAFTKAADRYFSDFASMIGESGKEKEYFSDLEDFDRSFRRWAKIDVEPSNVDK